MTKDLPEGVVGRIGLDTSRSNPGVVYALIEHREGSVFRSEDWGESWKRMCSTDRFKQVANRPFYYSQVRVDPNNDKTIYILAMGLTVSRDGGQNFFGIGSGIHSDHHALWIDPGNSLHLLEGNDGGIDISWDGGKTWIDIQAIDAAEVYQVGYDMRDPYYVYGGLQDNNTWGGPSSSLDTAGVLNADWFVINGGDGFFCRARSDGPEHRLFQLPNERHVALRRPDQRRKIRAAAGLPERAAVQVQLELPDSYLAA